MKIDTNIRIQAVKTYLEDGTLNETAGIFKIHRNTLWRWVKWYQKGGIENLTRAESYQKPWNRSSQMIEDKVVALKESIPSLTVRKAQKMLKAQKIEISIKNIWNIWQRYGLSGFAKARFSTSYREYLACADVSSKLVQRIKQLIDEKKIEQSAKLINALPIFPQAEILKEIPERLLSLRRQVDRLGTMFGAIPLSAYQKKAEILRKELAREKMHYSSLRAGIDEGYALMWLGQPKELLRLTNTLKKRTKGLRDPGLCFAITLFEGHALGSLLRIKEALKCAGVCKAIIHRLTNPYFLMGELAGLYSILGYFREAIAWTKKAVKEVVGDSRKYLYASLAGFLTTSGDYRTALKVLKEGKPEEWDYHSRAFLLEAFVCLNKGDFQEASSLAIKALQQSKKEEIRRFFHLTTFVLACCHAAVGERKETKTLLRKYNSFLKKYRLEKEYLLRKILLGDSHLPKGALLVPNLRLAYLFYQAKTTGQARIYHKALHYAHSQKLFGLFERLALFFPEPVIHLLKKGKDPQLPKRFLTMPIFQIESPVCNLRFFGKLKIFKEENLLRRTKLNPKDAAFLIHLSLNKNRRMLLSDIYYNFWPHSKNPARNLSHLLVRIKKALGIPSYLLRISRDILVWNFYLLADYDTFKESLAQAKALERAGEWGFARKEYLRAFRLFRGEPFRKMYDQWSEDMRHRILSQLETEAIGFAKSCIERDNEIRHKKRRTPSAKYRGGGMAEAKKVLERVLRIIPGSEEMKKLSDSLIV